MKKIGILLAILVVAGVCAMADDAVPAPQGAVLFADIDAVALSQAEMMVVDGGQRPDMYGSTIYGPYSKIEVKNSDWRKGGIEPYAAVSVSAALRIKTPGVEVGIDIYPKCGPYIKADVGPFTVKIRAGLRYRD